MRIDKLLSYFCKLHAHTARSSFNAEESELNVRDDVERKALIMQLDREIVTDDWRTLY